MSEIMVVIPTYNEVENLPAMVAELFDLDVEGLGILVIDDASPDGTGAVADELVERYPGLFHVIHRQGKLGLGTAYIEGYKWALGHGADVIIQMDADFSHSPKYVPELINNLADADVVIGSRYIKGGRLDERWGIGRRFLSWWANSIWVRTILGMNIRDATAGFKCWRRRSLEAIDLDKIRSNGYIFQVEMSYVAEKLGLRVKEIPIYFEDRQIGNSKMSTRVQLEAALRVFEIRWRYRGIVLMVRPFKTEKS
jgi:dolichol-phosphate mannosyltransferase